MGREILFESAGLLVVRQIQGANRSVVPPALPGPHQRVLQDRELVGVVADVVEQPLHQRRRDLHAHHAQRPPDRLLDLVPAHPRDDIEAVVQPLGKIAKLRAVSQEVGPQGEDDVNRKVALRGRFEQQLHHRRRFVGRLARVALSRW